jgi:CRISPR-associated protein Cas2
MTVITITDVPPSLRGDLTKWLFEINSGVYVGNLTARVREQLWQRVCDGAKQGRATMVFRANNEQHLDFRVHNTTWEPIDFDGLKLMMRPNSQRAQAQSELRRGFSNAAKQRKAQQMQSRQAKKEPPAQGYAVVDVETTGLSAGEHEIIEIGALKARPGEPPEAYQAYVKPSAPLPEAIAKLTGLTSEILQAQGRPLEEVLPEFLEFLGDLPMVSHNVAFDAAFLRAACQTCGMPPLPNQCIDTLRLSKRLVDSAQNYKLQTLLEHLGLPTDGLHRSLGDCEGTRQLYEKLKEIQQTQT